MESEILRIFASQGVWALLSLTLILYILKTQEKRDTRQEEREINYQNIIISLTKELEVLDSLKIDIFNIANQKNKK